MKLLSNFLYSVKQGIKGIFTNKTMSFITIISVSASLIILGIITHTDFTQIISIRNYCDNRSYNSK